MAEIKEFMIEDAKILFRNFEGKEGQYNRKGDRNFAVLIPPEQVPAMEADGWNVKMLAAREEGEEDVPYITVAVSYKNRPPRITMMTSRARTNLDEDTVEVLDWANIQSVDLICNSYAWNVGDKSGVKAYLKTLFVTIEEDELEKKYSANEVG